MQTVKKITLDINADYKESIDAKQNDTLSRYLEITLIDNGTVCDLTNNTVKIYVVKPDKTIVFNNIIVEDATNGLIKVELTSQMLAVVGQLNCELCIYGADNSILSSKAFNINVIACLHNDSAIQSTNEYTALMQALTQVTNFSNLQTEVTNARQGAVNLLANLQAKDNQINTINKLISIIQGQICPVGATMEFAMQVPPAGWLVRNGQAISRTTYTDLFNAITIRVTITAITNGSTSVTVNNTIYLGIGFKLEGVGIPAGATVASIIDSTHFVLSSAATATATSGTITAFVFGNGDGSTTFNVPDDRGLFMRGWDNGAGVDNGRVFGSYQDDDIKSHDHTVPAKVWMDDPSTNPANTKFISLDSGGNWMNTESVGGRTRWNVGATGGAETRSKNRAYLPCIKY